MILERLPNRITILGQKYRIIVNKHKLTNPSYYGECDFEKKQIVINDELDIEEKWRTLGHEVFHAMVARCGVRFSGSLKPEIEEILAESNGNLVADILFNSSISYYKPRKKIKKSEENLQMDLPFEK